jgi:hypothetical protein
MSDIGVDRKWSCHGQNDAIDPNRSHGGLSSLSWFLIDFSFALSAQEIGSGSMAEPTKRTILERFDVPDSHYETVIMHVEIAPLANTGLHTHPGFDAAYLLDGDLIVLERP